MSSAQLTASGLTGPIVDTQASSANGSGDVPDAAPALNSISLPEDLANDLPHLHSPHGEQLSVNKASDASRLAFRDARSSFCLAPSQEEMPVFNVEGAKLGDTQSAPRNSTLPANHSAVAAPSRHEVLQSFFSSLLQARDTEVASSVANIEQMPSSAPRNSLENQRLQFSRLLGDTPFQQQNPRKVRKSTSHCRPTAMSSR